MSSLIQPVRKLLEAARFELSVFSSRIASQTEKADLAIFHEFALPPSGGGHQFLRAFWRAAEANGLKVENNSISNTTRACLMNSFNFDERYLRRIRRNSVLYVHRVDGPIDTYRGRDDGVDRKIWQVNRELADKTIFQSHYSLEKHLQLGLEFKNPVVILNAAAPEIFNSGGRLAFSRERKTRLIASSWSDNINKGAPFYQWLDEHLDWERCEFTFIGHSPIQFQNIHMIPPVNSQQMAELFKQRYLYHRQQKRPLFKLLNRSIELWPAIFLKSGGHPEIVQDAGFGFNDADEIPELINRIVDEHEFRQDKIAIPSLDEVCENYLAGLELS